jgi:hypothetical protein
LSQPPSTAENGSEARFGCPPVTEELTPLVRLPDPPEIEAKSPACSVASPQVLATETLPVPARFEQPPAIAE